MAALAQPQKKSSPLDASIVKNFENELRAMLDLKPDDDLVTHLNDEKVFKKNKRLQVFVMMIDVFEELNDGGIVEKERIEENYDGNVDVINRTGIRDFEERIYDVLEEVDVPGENWEQWMKDIHEWEIVWLNINEK
eukprot:248418_1